MSFSENLRNFRKAFKLSQTDFAKKVGITRNQVANYETDTSEPKLSTLQKISEFFFVPVDSILANRPTITEQPIGTFYVKSNLFNIIETSTSDIYGFNYRFGAFKVDKAKVIEFLYLGSFQQPIIKYLLNESHSYDEFNRFTNLIDAQLGWRFVDKADTTTYIIVDNPAVPEKYYHIYGNYMSGMKVGEIYQTEFLEGIKENFSLDEEDLKIYLEHLYKS